MSVRWRIDIADADDTVRAVAAGEQPHVTGKAGGSAESMTVAADAAVKVLKQMAVHVDDSRRVRVALTPDDQGLDTADGDKTVWVWWTSPSAAARKIGELEVPA